MNIPLLIIVAMYLVSWGMSIGEHNQPKKGKTNANITFLAMVVQFILLYLAFKN